MKWIVLFLGIYSSTSCTLWQPTDGDDCGSSQFTFTSSCEEIQRRFYERCYIDAKYYACTQDSDCVQYSPGLHCASGVSIEICPRAFAEATLSEYKTKIEVIKSEICACSLARCSMSLCAITYPRCVDQQCIDMMDPPDAGQEDAE